MQGGYYHWYKEHGICTCCGKQDAIPGRTMCDDCLGLKRAENKERRKSPKVQDAMQAYRKRHWQERLEQGLCPRCGKPLYAGHKLCYECVLKNRRRGQQYRDDNPRTLKESWKKAGLCLKCGKPRVKDKMFCEEHYLNALQNIEKARIASGWTGDYHHRKYFTKRYSD